MTKGPRKTINVRDFVEANNRYLSAATSEREGRVGVAIAVEHALHMAGAYKGFSFLDSEYLPAAEQTPDQVLRADYDDTRRRYDTSGIPT